MSLITEEKQEVTQPELISNLSSHKTNFKPELYKLGGILVLE